MQDICARFQLSERGVQALIHSETGMGLPAYLLKLRLEQAAEQLVSDRPARLRDLRTGGV